MRLGEEGDPGIPIPPGAAPRWEVAEARDGRPPAAGWLLTPHAVASSREHLATLTGRDLECPGEEVELRLLHRRGGPLTVPCTRRAGPRPGSGCPRHVVGVIPRAATRITTCCRKPWRRPGGGGGAEPAQNTPSPPHLHVPAPLQILDDARHRIRIDAQEAGQLPGWLGSAWSGRDTAASMTCFVARQLPADRDRALLVHLEDESGQHDILYLAQ